MTSRPMMPLRALASLALALVAAPLAPAGGERVLFAFDDDALPFQQGVRLRLIDYQAKLVDAEPVNIVMRPGPAGAPDSIGCYYYGSVQQVGDELWMWYLGTGDHDPAPLVNHLKVCFAKSRDGRHWEKPDLGLAEYAGSRKNNLVSLDGKPFAELVESVVIYEPEEPDPSRRFKMAFEDKKRYGMRLAVAFSADGTHWTEPPGNPCGPTCEMSGLTKWHGAYYVSGHASGHWAPEGKSPRVLDSIVSYDFLHWYETPALGFRRDPLPPRPTTATGTADGEQVHLGASLWNRGNVILGFYGQWHGVPTNDRTTVPVDIGLVISHDALHYAEPVPDFRIITAKENVYSWPAQSPINAPSLAQGQGFINRGDETLVWYGIWNNPAAGIRLASWKRDRFGYLQPFVGPEGKAIITSQAIDLSGPAAEISLNVGGLNDLSRVRVSLLDESFHEVPGYTSATCTAPTASGLRQRVTWTGHDRTPTTPFRIRLEFSGVRPEDVQLYAIYVTPAP